MATAKYWNVYKFFNEPPGRQDLKCIECRYAAAGASSVVGLIGAYGVKKTMMANVYKGMAFVFISILGFSAATVALRAAKEDQKWNEIKLSELKERMSKERKEYRESNKKLNQ